MSTIEEILNSIPSDIFPKLVPKHSIVTTLRGSLAHGTHIPPEADGVDDIDLMSVYLADTDFYLGLPTEIRGQDIKIVAWDAANYEFRHFCKLLANGNPNVISMLWTAPQYLTANWLGLRLLNNRELFLTKRLGKSFGGYASGQLHRMTAYHEETSSCGCTGEFHGEGCAVLTELGRGSTKRYATGFMGAKRKELVKKHGYDAKNAAHAIRLLTMAVEIFRDGQVLVDRTGLDAEYLKSVKRGERSLAEVQSVATGLNDELSKLVVGSKLPDEVDRGRVNHLISGILKIHLDTA
jgi:hypothetical protein